MENVKGKWVKCLTTLLFVFALLCCGGIVLSNQKPLKVYAMTTETVATSSSTEYSVVYSDSYHVFVGKYVSGDTLTGEGYLTAQEAINAIDALRCSTSKPLAVSDTDIVANTTYVGTDSKNYYYDGTNWYVDCALYFYDENSTSFTLQIEGGRSSAFVFATLSKGNYIISGTFTYGETKEISLENSVGDDSVFASTTDGTVCFDGFTFLTLPDIFLIKNYTASTTYNTQKVILRNSKIQSLISAHNHKNNTIMFYRGTVTLGNLNDADDSPTINSTIYSNTKPIANFSTSIVAKAILTTGKLTINGGYYENYYCGYALSCDNSSIVTINKYEY